MRRAWLRGLMSSSRCRVHLRRVMSRSTREHPIPPPVHPPQHRTPDRCRGELNRRKQGRRGVHAAAPGRRRKR
eukprot:scaffold249423_cov14-Tisochrysis_lutea.AAC.1